MLPRRASSGLLQEEVRGDTNSHPHAARHFPLCLLPQAAFPPQAHQLTHTEYIFTVMQNSSPLTFPGHTVQTIQGMRVAVGSKDRSVRFTTSTWFCRVYLRTQKSHTPIVGHRTPALAPYSMEVSHRPQKDTQEMNPVGSCLSCLWSALLFLWTEVPFLPQDPRLAVASSTLDYHLPSWLENPGLVVHTCNPSTQ